MAMEAAGTVRIADPTLIDGKKAPLRLDATGALVTSTSGGATAANQTTLNTEVGAVNETAPASDTASSGLNGRLQRIAQRLTSIIALLPAALGSAGGLKVEQQASEVHLGEVGTPAILVDVTPVCDTSIYAAGDTVFDKTVVTGALRINDGFGVLESLQVIDKDDQGAALDIYFFSSNITTFGTANAAPSISDADAATLLGIVSVATGDYKDLGGVKVASVKAINAILKAASGAKTIYVAATTSGTPTYTASGLVLRVGILQG